jgi:hypothetical protein
VRAGKKFLVARTFRWVKAHLHIHSIDRARVGERDCSVKVKVASINASTAIAIYAQSSIFGK